MMTSPQTAEEIFDGCFLEVRAKLLEIAASMDRIERADSDDAVQNDPRLAQIRESLEILNSRGFDRAERIQMVFSDEYDPDWNR